MSVSHCWDRSINKGEWLGPNSKQGSEFCSLLCSRLGANVSRPAPERLRRRLKVLGLKTRVNHSIFGENKHKNPLSPSHNGQFIFIDLAGCLLQEWQLL